MNIFRLEIRNLRRGTLMSCGSIGVIIALMLAFFPAMQTESMMALAGAKLEGISPLLLQALGLSKMLDFSVITYYFGYVIQFVGLAVMVVVMQQATALLIKEETDGTIEFLGAKPVSRGDIFSGKILAHLAVTCLSMLIYALVTLAGYLIVSELSPREALYEVATLYAGLLFAAAVFSAAGFCLSSYIKSSKSASNLTIAVVFGSFLLGILSVIVPDLKFLHWLSPMEWIKTDKLMNEGLRASEGIAGLSMICACLLAAWLRYRKKDLLIS